MIDPRNLAVLAFAALLCACAVAWPQDPPPSCGPAAVAGRVDLDRGDQAPADCACYDATAETCMLSTIHQLRGDLAAERATAAEKLAAAHGTNAELSALVRSTVDDLEQVRADLLAGMPPWWDSFAVGAGATLVVTAAGLVLVAIITR